MYVWPNGWHEEGMAWIVGGEMTKSAVDGLSLDAI